MPPKCKLHKSTSPTRSPTRIRGSPESLGWAQRSLIGAAPRLPPRPPQQVREAALPTGNGRALFIGVDGVLHPKDGAFLFDAECMRSLRQIVEQTGASIVLTSSWQATPAGRRQVNDALRRWGIPVLLACTVHGSPGSGDEQRTAEIANWMATKQGQAACAHGYAILDDGEIKASTRAASSAFRTARFPRSECPAPTDARTCPLPFAPVHVARQVCSHARRDRPHVQSSGGRGEAAGR